MRYEYAAPIDTKRLILRRVTEDDAAAIHAYSSREDVTRYLYWDPRTRDESREATVLKTGRIALGSDGDALALGVVRRDSGDLIGDVVLMLVSVEHRQAEIGYIIHPDHQGSGFATEAVRPLLAIAFELLGAHRVVGRIEARNAPSERVLEKLGMRREAHLIENEFVKGEWQSELVYAMLDREWRAEATMTAVAKR